MCVGLMLALLVGVTKASAQQPLTGYPRPISSHEYARAPGDFVELLSPSVTGILVGMHYDGDHFVCTSAGPEQILLIDLAGSVFGIISIDTNTAGAAIDITLDQAACGDSAQPCAYVVDNQGGGGADEVDIYTNLGGYLTSFPLPLSSFTEGITFRPATGTLYILDSANPTAHVYEYALDGTLLTTHDLPELSISPDGIVWDGPNHVFWIYDGTTDSLEMYTAGFAHLGTVPVDVIGQTGAAGEGIALVGETAYIAEATSRTISGFDTAGAVPLPIGRVGVALMCMALIACFVRRTRPRVLP